MTRIINKRNIKRLLTDVFNEEGLREFCFYEPSFREVYETLTAANRKPEIIRKIIEFANHKNLIDIVLEKAKENNSSKYEEYKPYFEDEESEKINVKPMKVTQSSSSSSSSSVPPVVPPGQLKNQESQTKKINWKMISIAIGIVIGIVIVTIVGWIIIVTILDQCRLPNCIVIDDFENDIDGWFAAREDWGPREVALNVFHSTDAASGRGALQCEFDFNRTKELDPRATCFLTELPTQDWTDYYALQFKAKSLVDPNSNLRTFIALATGDDSCWHELGEFQSLDPDYQTFTFRLDRASYKSCRNNFEKYDQVLIGKDQVIRIHLIFTTNLKPAGSVLVDDIWLLKP